MNSPTRRPVTVDVAGMCVCPVHGPQDCEYLPGSAPCGCTWVANRHGLLFAEVATATSDDAATKSATTQRNSHNTQSP